MLAEPALAPRRAARQRHADRGSASRSAQRRGLAQRVAQAPRGRAGRRGRGEPRQRALDIGAAAQPLAQGRRAALGRSTKNSTASSRAAIAAGSVSGAARCSARSRAPAPVTVRSIVASRLPLRSPASVCGQFEIAPRRRVDLHDRAGGEPARRLQQRQRALLGQRDVIDERAGGGELGAAEAAEPVERARRRRTPARRRRAVSLSKRGLGSGVSAGLPLGEQLEERRARQQPLRQQDLAGHQPRQRRRRAPRSVVGGSAKAPVDRSSQASADLAAGLGDAGEIIVPARVEEAVLGQGAGGDDADDGAPHRPLAAALLAPRPGPRSARRSRP